MVNQTLKNSLYALLGKSAKTKKSDSGGFSSINVTMRALYYSVFAQPMQFNAWRHRTLVKPRTGVVKVHLGPGRVKYFPGWVNVDANFISAKIDVWADLKNRLPFRDQSVDVFYSYHVIEHLPDNVLPFHFQEMYRCLKPGGLIRISGPHGENALRKYMENDHNWFYSKKRSIGGRLSDFIMCGGDHIVILTPSFLSELAGLAGFVDIRVCQPMTQTYHRDLIDPSVLQTEGENTPEVPHTLTIEAVKPGRKPVQS